MFKHAVVLSVFPSFFGAKKRPLAEIAGFILRALREKRRAAEYMGVLTNFKVSPLDMIQRSLGLELGSQAGIRIPVLEPSGRPIVAGSKARGAAGAISKALAKKGN